MICTMIKLQYPQKMHKINNGRQITAKRLKLTEWYCKRFSVAIYLLINGPTSREFEIEWSQIKFPSIYSLRDLCLHWNLHIDFVDPKKYSCCCFLSFVQLPDQNEIPKLCALLWLVFFPVSDRYIYDVQSVSRA